MFLLELIYVGTTVFLLLLVMHAFTRLISPIE